jgi:outer membrane receptor protein involved in Fe transport
MIRLFDTTWSGRRMHVLLALCLLLWPAAHAFAQGVTTSAMGGAVKDSQGLAVPGAVVTAVHEPSGTQYEAVTQADGRYSILGMRVGGPYTIQATLEGFQPQPVKDVYISLGVTADIPLTLLAASVTETITVTATSDPIFSSSRTGAGTAVSREDLATLPTTAGRLGDFTRLSPFAGGNQFGAGLAGQDGRLNNITVDGSSFNNSFGLAGAPGERTQVAPISLEAIEQVQVNVAPFDVRQGNFVGGGVNTVTRSGTNKLTGSIYTRFRNDEFVGTEAKGLPYNPGSFDFNNTGGWASGPILKNRLFAFGLYEDEEDTRPITPFRANAGGEAVSGNVTRVLSKDLDDLSAFLQQRYNYETGPYDAVDDLTPVKRFLVRGDWNINNSNKFSLRYNYLDSSTDALLSGSSSLGLGRGSGNSPNFLSYANSNYAVLENIRSTIGEWNSVFGTSLANSLIVGYTKQDESRGYKSDTLFPFVDILDGSGVAYTSFGFEPFTPNNELRYNTLQIQDNLTKFSGKHTMTFGASLERYESENVFFPGSQSAYVFNTLADFYAAANGQPVTTRRFQVRYMNIPGLEKPIQPLEVWYNGYYAQDEWRPRSNLSVTGGVRLDIPYFGDTAYENPAVDALTFRDENGQPVQFSTGKLPDPSIHWSPRVGFNWDVASDQKTQIRGGTGVFSGRPAYVWISNQIGNTGVLTGFVQADNTTAYPFNPNPAAYKPTSVTGAPAASVDLAVTDQDFRFPQVWRSNIAVDRRIPWGMVAGVEYIYNKDVNGIYYINANLPAAQSSFAGADNRPRWVGAACGSGTAGPCVNRINNAPGNQITQAIALKNQDVGRSWNIAATLSKPLAKGFSFRGAYSYGESRNTIDPGSIASGSWTGNPQRGDPNNPGLGYSAASPGHRVFLQANYTQNWFKFGATTISAFWEGRTIGNSSYLFAGDMNGDTATNNDLIYIPRDMSEMNFSTFTSGGVTFTAEQQAAAWEAYINQDEYLSKHRGEYAERGALFLPMVYRMDLSLVQDFFANLGGRRHTFQFRIDIDNFSNMLNSDWGVRQRVIQNQILTNPAVDAQGRSTYRLRVVNNQLINKTFESTVGNADVYQFMISFRYLFN